MADPVSWLEIEQGWAVVAAGGEELGTVSEVTGDRRSDIFDGLAVRFGLAGPPRYVPAEKVGEIVEGRVGLTLSRAEAEQLDRYEEPPEEVVVSSEPASLLTRIGSFVGWKRRS